MGEGLFNSIASAYGLFFTYQTRFFSAIIDKHEHAINLTGMESVCDVGCGTGALCEVLAQRGYRVTGVDPAVKMLETARRKTTQPIEFIHADAVEGLPFQDLSFDVVFASFVAHGMDINKRTDFYRELRRIARHAVVIHDYNANRGLLTSVVEWAERGDYFEFIKRPQAEMEEIFSSISVIQVGKRASWYVCRCSSKAQERLGPQL